MSLRGFLLRELFLKRFLGAFCRLDIWVNTKYWSYWNVFVLLENTIRSNSGVFVRDINGLWVTLTVILLDYWQLQRQKKIFSRTRARKSNLAIGLPLSLCDCWIFSYWFGDFSLIQTNVLIRGLICLKPPGVL
jgi:hypothetical protein